MKTRIWGARGSITTPEANKLKVGGNTSCLELEYSGGRIILDAGTGIRPLGKKIAREILSGGGQRDITIVLSHTHWDHIQGFPFFAPVFLSGVNIHIYGPVKANRRLEQTLSGHMEYDYWPVKFSHLAARFYFHELTEGTHALLDGVSVTCRRHIHPGVAFGYRIEADGKTMVYSTDTEHFQNSLDHRVVELSEGADLLVHDAQYTDDEIQSRYGWGHSTWQQAVQVAREAHVRKLVLFHQDPERADDAAMALEAQAADALPGTALGIEGREFEL